MSLSLNCIKAKVTGAAAWKISCLGAEKVYEQQK